ncbi:MAG: GntR family transcriptional regulator [Marivivens sp.]|nr:GntR family transcriptional regulator [Marivivens sp.]
MILDTHIDPAKLTRATRVSNEIRDAIIAGKMRPGAKVNLDQLRDEYGVSLSPIREAISRLVADRLVEFEDKKGFRIVPLCTANLLEITRLRADFEALALKHAIAIGTLEWESKIPAAIHHMNNSTGTRQAAAHDLFHASLVHGLFGRC